MKSLYDALHPEKPSETEEKLSGEWKLTAKDFSKGIVQSPEYRASIERRILNDTLPPAVECRILDHALGKPVERIETRDRTPLEDFTEDMARRRVAHAQRLLDLIRLTRTNDEVHAASSEEDDGPLTPSSVH